MTNYFPGEAELVGRDGYYWQLDPKITDKRGNTIIATAASQPLVCRDDLGAGPLLLSPDLFLYFG